MSMTFGEVFQPGLRHWREYRDRERLLGLTYVSPGPRPGQPRVDMERRIVELDDLSGHHEPPADDES